MNQGFIWMIVAILALIFLLFVVFTKKGKKPKTDYKMIANFGIMFTILGIYSYIRSGETTFFLIGIVYLIAGYKNKDKWKKK